METPTPERRPDAPVVPAEYLAPGSIYRRILEVLLTGGSDARRTDGLVAGLAAPRKAVCDALAAMRKDGLVWFAGRTWVLHNHAGAALQSKLVMEDAERAFDQANDAWIAAHASGDAERIKEATETLERASARLDELAPSYDCSICNEPMSKFDCYLGLKTHSRCETLEAQETMTDEEMDAILAERPLHERDAQEAA